MLQVFLEIGLIHIVAERTLNALLGIQSVWHHVTANEMIASSLGRLLPASRAALRNVKQAVIVRLRSADCTRSSSFLEWNTLFETLVASPMVVKLQCVMNDELRLRSASETHQLTLVYQKLLLLSLDCHAIYHIDAVCAHVARRFLVAQSQSLRILQE